LGFVVEVRVVDAAGVAPSLVAGCPQQVAIRVGEFPRCAEVVGVVVQYIIVKFDKEKSIS
jgi:hypothetical protein